MPTKNPRLHVVLEPPLFRNLKGLAQKNGISISLEARELIREALRSTGQAGRRVYTGKHFGKLIGAFRLGKKWDPDQTLAEQTHG